MHLCYLDENKPTDIKPQLIVGGFVIEAKKAIALDEGLCSLQALLFDSSSNPKAKSREFHGVHILQGKGNFKSMPLQRRVAIFEVILDILATSGMQPLIAATDPSYSDDMDGVSHYRFSLSVALLAFNDFLETKSSWGIICADYEKDEISKATRDFEYIKKSLDDKGISTNRLIDTVYFTQSHHSRLVQAADILVYLAGRYGKGLRSWEKWHDKKISHMWAEFIGKFEVIGQEGGGGGATSP